MQQRQIKFRAWSNRDKCWCGAFSIHKTGLFSECINASVVNGVPVADAHWQDLFTQDEIVLEQFTGLLDKNGKEIYEGDIVRFRYADNVEPTYQGTIAFVNRNGVYQCAAFLIAVPNGTPYDIPLAADWIEVIGNIHENPDLIESDANQQEV